MRDSGLYVMSVASELAGLHPQTLRIYERKGLIDPMRTAGGSRRYSNADLERLRRIGDLTDAGVNLEGVRRILELEDELTRLRGELAAARAEADRQLRLTEAQYRRDLVPVRSGQLVPLRQRTKSKTSVDGRRDHTTNALAHRRQPVPEEVTELLGALSAGR